MKLSLLVLFFLQLIGILHLANAKLPRENNGTIDNPITRPQNQDDTYFTTRKPTTNRSPSQPPGHGHNKRPPPLNVRFDEKDSDKVKKLLQFDEEVSSNIETFSLKLFSQFSSDQNLATKNFMMSPFSIYHLLTMITEGANGSTLAQLQKELNITQLQKTRDFEQYLNFYLSKTNIDALVKKFALFINDKNRPVLNDYESTIEKSYGAIVESVQFQNIEETLKTVNDLVSSKTDGHLTEAIFRDDLLKAQLILITGLYFKASWKNQFNITDTRREKFFDSDGKHIGFVDMMYQRGVIAFNAIEELGCYALEMEYADPPPATTSRTPDLFASGLSMIILLPKKGQTLSETVFKLYGFTLPKLYRALHTAKLDYADDEVEVYLPKFEINSDLDVQTILKRLGITEIFDARANLSKINRNYYISAMIHKAKVNVDESGTVASSTTSAIFANKSTPSKFLANKPFLFLIVDKFANLVLFCGQFSEPTFSV